MGFLYIFNFNSVFLFTSLMCFPLLNLLMLTASQFGMVQCMAALFNYFMCQVAILKYFTHLVDFTALFDVPFQLISYSSHEKKKIMKYVYWSREINCKVHHSVVGKYHKSCQSVMWKKSWHSPAGYGWKSWILQSVARKKTHIICLLIAWK